MSEDFSKPMPPEASPMKRYVVRWTRVNETVILAWNDKDANDRAQSLIHQNPGTKLLSCIIEDQPAPLPHIRMLDAVLRRISGRING